MDIECRICGEVVWVSAIKPAAARECPSCGSPLRLRDAPKHMPNPLRRLSELGADVELDEHGEVQSIQLTGVTYNDPVIEQLAQLGEVSLIDIRDTAISEAGAARLARLLPNTTILY